MQHDMDQEKRVDEREEQRERERERETLGEREKHSLSLTGKIKRGGGGREEQTNMVEKNTEKEARVTEHNFKGRQSNIEGEKRKD